MHLELSVVLSPPAKGTEEGSIRVENLDSVIPRVRNKDEATFIHSNTPGGGGDATVLKDGDINGEIGGDIDGVR